MKTTSIWLALACIAVLSSCKKMDSVPETTETPVATAQRATAATTFTNPVIADGKDPQVFEGNGKFWLFFPGISNNSNYTLYSSTNLVNWTLETTNTFFNITSGDLWSGGSYKFVDSGNEQRYNVYFTRVFPSDSKKRTIGVARTNTPQGPFEEWQPTDLLVKSSGGVSVPVIDPAVFKDPVSGNVYMYYAQGVGAPGNPTLRCVQLTTNGRELVAGTDQQVLSITQAWEYENIEHPYVYYAPNASASHRYYMLYNGAGGALARYSIGYAYSSSPTGPFTKAPAGNNPGQNPIVKQNPSAGIYGPGAPNSVVDGAGIRWLIYRIKTTPGESWGDRAICINELYRNSNDELICTPTKGTATPAPTF